MYFGASVGHFGVACYPSQGLDGGYEANGKYGRLSGSVSLKPPGRLGAAVVSSQLLLQDWRSGGGGLRS